ncbi:MAG: deoxynucleoside kinase [Pseudomonadota bacterium]
MAANGTVLEICGNVASGKSTLATHLRDALGAQTVLERPDRLSLFESYIRDPKNWAYQMQLQFLSDKFSRYQALQLAKLGVLDRSFEEDATIFARLHFELGNITEERFARYTDVYNAMMSTRPSSTLKLLVACSPQTVLARIEQRSPKERKMLRGSYFERLIELYAEFTSQTSFDIVYDSETETLASVTERIQAKLG